MITGTQRAYGEWYARSISLDRLYTNSMFSPKSDSRQIKRAKDRALKKELQQTEKRRLRKQKRIDRRNRNVSK